MGETANTRVSATVWVFDGCGAHLFCGMVGAAAWQACCSGHVELICLFSCPIKLCLGHLVGLELALALFDLMKMGLRQGSFPGADTWQAYCFDSVPNAHKV